MDHSVWVEDQVGAALLVRWVLRELSLLLLSIVYIELLSTVDESRLLPLSVFFSIELLSRKDKTCLLLGKPVPDLVLHRLSQVRSLPKDIQLVTSMKGTFFHQNNVKLANNDLKSEIGDS